MTDTRFEESSGNPEFDKLLQLMANLHRIKSHDYGEGPYGSLLKSKALGILPSKAVLVRMGDKWGRIESLSTKEPKVVSEKIEDTLLDLAVYSLLCILLLQQETKHV